MASRRECARDRHLTARIRGRAWRPGRSDAGTRLRVGAAGTRGRCCRSHAEDRSPGRHRARRRGVRALLHGRSSTRRCTRSRFRAASATSSCSAICRSTARWATSPSATRADGARTSATSARRSSTTGATARRSSTALEEAVDKAGLGKLSGGGGHRRDLRGSRRHRDPVPAGARHAGDSRGALGPGRPRTGPGHATRASITRCCTWRTSRRACGSTASSTAGRRSARSLPSASGSRLAIPGLASNRPRQGRSRTSSTSPSKSPPSTVVPSPKDWPGWERRSSRPLTKPPSSGSATSMGSRWNPPPLKAV